MPKKKGKKAEVNSGQPASLPFAGDSPAELQQIASLLQLLRSASPFVQSLVSAGQELQRPSTPASPGGPAAKTLQSALGTSSVR